MGNVTKIAAGIGIVVLLLIGAYGLYPAEPLTVAYATLDDGNVTIESPLPPYAHLDKGVLVVDISPDSPFSGEGRGLSPDSTYVFNDVFTVTNNVSETGYSRVCVRISSDSPNIGFFEGEFSGRWDGGVEVELAANETIPIGMRVNTTGLRPGDLWSDITIEAWGGGCR